MTTVEGTWMIGIVGPSCSGKTELARTLAARLPHAETAMLCTDDYYRDLSHLPPEERERQNFDHPDAVEGSLLQLHLRALAAGREINRPVYRFDTHTRAAETERVCPSPFIIVEGLYCYYWAGIRRMLQTRVFIEADDRICFSRRLERDVRERGRDRRSVIAQYVRHTRPMFERYVLPTRRFANVVLPCRDRADAEAGVVQVLRHLASQGRHQLALPNEP